MEQINGPLCFFDFDPIYWRQIPATVHFAFSGVSHKKVLSEILEIKH